MNAFVLCLIALLSSDSYGVRESASAGLHALADWETIDGAWKASECPEAKGRLYTLRCAFTIRECDRLAGKRYPRSYQDLKWPVIHNYKYSTETFEKIALLELAIFWPREFWDRSCYSDGKFINGEGERETTRRSLVLYASRTGDWETVRRILK